MQGVENSTPVHLNRCLIHWSRKEIFDGQLWSISVAIALIVACVFALAGLAERMEQVIVKQGKDALTADLVFRSSNPFPASLLAASTQQGVTQSKQVSYSTMAFSDSDMQLVMVKAVESNYPLHGQLLLSDDKEAIYNQVNVGELWLDATLFSLLNVSVGDSVTIGDGDFIVSGQIDDEPGLSFNPFQQMPTVLIHYQDVSRTEAIQAGSRVRYQALYTGSPTQLEQLKESVTLTPSDRWQDQGENVQAADIFQRATQYLSLTVAIVILMAATTLVLTCQHYVNGRRQTVAMLKSIGATKAWISRWLAIQVGMLLIVGCILGLSLGFGLEILLRVPLVDLLPDPLPSYGLTPIGVALVTCILIGVPALGIPLLKLINASALNVLQPTADSQPKSHLGLIFVPLLPLIATYYTNVLVWIVLFSMVALFIVLGLLSVLLTKLLAKATWRPAMALAISRLNRSTASSGLQFGALSLSLMLLAIIWLVRADLLNDWQKTLPENAPNAFAVNIAPHELFSYFDQLEQQNIGHSPAFPIIRGRLTQINANDAQQRGDTDAVRRELNLTWADYLPSYNDIESGEWTLNAGVSVESEVANDLGIKIGDSLTFIINAQEVVATVNSIRTVDWKEMMPNFYFIFTPDLVEHLPATYMVSFKMDESHASFIQQLTASHPTVSLLDVRKVAGKLQTVLEKIVWSITVLATLGVVAGLLLIFTLLHLSLSQRQLEIRLYRTLGSSRQRITQTIWCEFGIMALIAGVVASFGAEVAVSALMSIGFSLPVQLHGELWLALPMITFIILALAVSSALKQLLKPMKNGSL